MPKLVYKQIERTESKIISVVSVRKIISVESIISVFYKIGGINGTYKKLIIKLCER